ncbi:MAG: hypothetical protein ACRDTF_05730 [Pseudonocardiaceae bacterium]
MQRDGNRMDPVNDVTTHVAVPVATIYRAIESNGDERHPGWCSAEHCYRTDHSGWVHLQAPSRWEDGEVRFTTWLMSPDDDATTYLELHVEDLRFTWRCVDAYLSVPAARQLCDRLSAHLEIVASEVPVIGDE